MICPNTGIECQALEFVSQNAASKSDVFDIDNAASVCGRELSDRKLKSIEARNVIDCGLTAVAMAWMVREQEYKDA